MSTYENVVAALGEHGFPVNRNMARCPAHDDGTASLSVTSGQNGALLCCQAGCSTSDVVAAIGLTMADLFDEPAEPKRTAQKREVVAIYEYHDGTGSLLFEHVRYSPKGFGYRAPKPGGGYDYRLPVGVERPLFRRAEVARAVAEGETVYVTEGEKDCLAIVAAGSCATSADGGAGKWWPSHTAGLRGASHVIIWLDADLAGYRHGLLVRDALRGHVGEIEVIRSRHAKDAAEHLGAGHPLNGVEVLDDATLDRLCADDQSADSGHADELEDWPDATPLTTRPSLPMFPVGVLPHVMRALATEVAAELQVPFDLVAMPAMAVIAASAPREMTVTLRPGYLVPMTLWTCVLAEPGEGKSPAMDKVAAPLVEIEERDIEAFTQTKSSLKAAFAIATKRVKTAENTDDATEIAAAYDALDVAERALCPPRRLVDDATPEGMAELLAIHGRLAVISAEPQLFAVAAGRYSSGTPSFEALLKGYDGESTTVDRRGREPLLVRKPHLTVGIATQPDAFRALLNAPGAKDRGLIPRLMISWPESRVGRRDRRSKPTAPATLAAWADCVRTVAWNSAEHLRFSEEANEARLAWECSIEPRLDPLRGDLAPVVSHASKASGLIGRLAGVLHLAESPTVPVISAQTVKRAIVLVEYSLIHAAAILATTADSDAPMASMARHLVGLAERHDWATGALEVTAGVLAHSLRRGPCDGQNVPALVARFVELNWARQTVETVRRGRPTEGKWSINPAVLRCTTLPNSHQNHHLFDNGRLHSEESTPIDGDSGDDFTEWFSDDLRPGSQQSGRIDGSDSEECFSDEAEEAEVWV